MSDTNTAESAPTFTPVDGHAVTAIRVAVKDPGACRTCVRRVQHSTQLLQPLLSNFTLSSAKKLASAT